MTEAECLTALTALFRDVFDEPELVISPATTAADVEAWDSMTHISLMAAVEQRFGVRFRSAEVEKLASVGALVKAILAKTK